jgi:hypothetical protein
MSVHVARDHCLAPSRIVESAPTATRYGRLLPDLPAHEADDDALLALGGVGGICDASAAIAKITRLADDATGAAGWPFFGQFIAHDITADRSPLTIHADVTSLRNARTPRIDLEALYGAGPVGSPYLFDRDDPSKMLLGEGGFEVPRNSQGTAIIGDPRNDVHLFVNQLHVAFLRAHNGLVDRLRADGESEDELYESARRALRWHYQYVVVADYLPGLVGAELVDSVLGDGPRLFDPPPGEAYIPLEFADAAFRYGHGQIRHAYRLQVGGPEYPLFPDLVGFGPVPPEHRLDWSVIFDLPGAAPAQRAKKLDGRLPASLIGLPHQVTGDVEVEAYRSLAALATGLPSGEAVAAALGLEPLTAQEVGLVDFGGTPLWLYVLKEAQFRAGGDGLGPVAGRIVAEVLIGLIRADGESYLSVDPKWRPTLPSADPDHFGLGDLLVFATRGAPTTPDRRRLTDDA